MISPRTFVLAIALLTIPVYSFSQTSVQVPTGAIRGITFNIGSLLVDGPLSQIGSFASFVFDKPIVFGDYKEKDKDKDKKEKKPKKNFHGDEMSERVAILAGISALFIYVLMSHRRSRQRAA